MLSALPATKSPVAPDAPRTTARHISPTPALLRCRLADLCSTRSQQRESRSDEAYPVRSGQSIDLSDAWIWSASSLASVAECEDAVIATPVSSRSVTSTTTCVLTPLGVHVYGTRVTSPTALETCSSLPILAPSVAISNLI